MTLTLRDGHTLLVSPTQIDRMKTCMRMWRHNYVDLRVAARAAAARDGGKAFDAAMNIRYTRSGSAAPDAACEAAQIAASDAVFATLDLPLDEWRTAARYADAIRLYNEHYRDEPFDVLGVQQPFEVALGRIAVPRTFWPAIGRPAFDISCPEYVQIRLHGILDLRVRHRSTGLGYVMDTKVKGRWGAAEQAEFDNSGQMKAYCWAVPQATGEAVEGAWINAIVLREPYKRISSATAATAKPRTEFHRFIVSYSAERLEEWRRDALAYVRQALACVAEDHFPQNERHCASFYGRKCDYIDVCKAPLAQRALILGSDEFEDYKRGPLGDADAAQEEAI